VTEQSVVTQIPQAAAPDKPKGFIGYVRVFLELVKFEHSIFALPYAYIGAIFGAVLVTSRIKDIFVRPWTVVRSPDFPAGVTGNGWPSWWAILWITVAMVGARAVAFAINRAVDREIDARNPRTASRAMAAGTIRTRELWAFAVLMLALYLIAVVQLAPITHFLWPIPLAMFLAYPYLKRFTPLAHYWLGASLGLAAVAGWIAVGAPIAAWQPWCFGLAVTVWTAGFDIIYATQDYDCDVRDGVHSMPADFGIPAALWQVRILHVLTIILFAIAGWGVNATWPYYVGIAAAAALLIWENSIVTPDDLSRVDAAFFVTNGFIAIIILAGAIASRFVH
jgi:4-hydroxybenzoate polyprenyltransferase